MKITRTYPFWTWLMRLAYRRIKTDQKFTGIGVPGLRDKENPCDWYSPRKPHEMESSKCDGDGHYLCKECAYFNNPHPPSGVENNTK